MNQETLKKAANPLNPRTITPEGKKRLSASLAAFGDLGGIVFNEASGKLVSGHQRIDSLQGFKVRIKTRLKKPDATGTVALGVIEAAGTTYAYRVVRWDERKESEAMIAANNHGGQFDNAKLEKLLQELPVADAELIGYEKEELESLLDSIRNPKKKGTAKQRSKPKDDYASFTLLMLSPNKDILTEALAEVKKRHSLSNQEAAMMRILKLANLTD